MTSHLGTLLLFALAVSIVFGTLSREDAGDAWRLSSRIFAALVVGAYAVGWLMHLVFR